MASVHILGHIYGARGVGSIWTNYLLRAGGGQALWCRWEIVVEDNLRWTKEHGTIYEDGEMLRDQHGNAALSEVGQTQCCECSPGGLAVWSHPVDVKYRTTSLTGWPSMLFEVWSQDGGGRNEIVGYAVCHIPAAPGFHEIEVPIWRPLASQGERGWWRRMSKSLSGWFLGIWPRLNDDGSSATRTFTTAAKNVLYNPINFTKERSAIETVGTGSLMVKLSVITRGFDKYGPGTNLAVEEAWRKQQGEL
ncbi:hypothetical protein GUITHDRAFT_153660 [Guillardia theta CCMP2712]|uniref:B9 domain-containing protein 2 n=1 Tax=Guillardia theta (strain CCMP2712) TaxID=905079 RepID=L1J1X3_GUITC|nr:hypothetical protein GUITHDRAFT_153660 [Guillardia theta CCMP2712]EKX42095.1 hypothetical protein GUITHDRAFT_153660 [Guillardia theta CCMP2712]|eukprot:XP_005829075.1 hypothetical protein GUITHDRAFT_153660 [Guillardia theta CCMP2712]